MRRFIKIFQEKIMPVTVVLLLAGATAMDISAQTSAKKKGGGKTSTVQTKNANTGKGTVQSKGGKADKGKVQSKTASTGGYANKGTSKKGVGGKNSAAKQSAPSTPGINEMKKQQAATQQEIAKTRQEIKVNEQAVKKGLAELQQLQSGIEEGKRKLAEASGQVKNLETEIQTVSGEIAKENRELEKLRGEYLKAVKAMRLKRKSESALAFIFSSRNFSEAMRRMRYLKEFSEWRGRRNKDINQKVEHLKQQQEQLAKAKADKDVALHKEAEAQSQLQQQYAAQDAMIIKLKANGEALKTHLAQKQAEANALKGRVAALIAEEQRKEAARREAARKAEEERKRQLALEEQRRKEAAAKAEAEARRLAAEQEAREKAAAAKELARVEAEKKKAEAERKKAEQLEREGRRKEAEKARQQAEKAKKEAEKAEKEAEKKRQEVAAASNKEFAAARKRRPRGQASQVDGLEKPAPAVGTGKALEKTTTDVKSAVGGAGFASMKGSLPRPVAGSFRITSRFGRHALPELPDVMYDNPGIDAQVSKGASAQAVFGGKVSGVYVVPGYSTVVIVNHGDYYTVYGNIQQSSVKVGDTVKQGQGLGRLAPEEDTGHSLIHFEVWHNRDKLNPAEWIR